MKKSWLGRFSRSENHGMERRADVAEALEPIVGTMIRALARSNGTAS